MPKHFPDAAVAINPSFSDQNALSEIKAYLQGFTGQVATEYAFAQGNHFYHDGHMGVYIRNPDNKHVAMPAYLRTQYCKIADATIMFTPDRAFVLEYQMNGVDGKLGEVRGRYTYDGKTLSLQLINGQLRHYLFSKEEKETYAGMRPADVYKPVGKSHNVAALNCEFLIIYMDQRV